MTHRNADTRIREAFDALRAEMVSLFGEPPAQPDHRKAGWLVWQVHHWLEVSQDIAHDFAKLPADA